MRNEAVEATASDGRLLRLEFLWRGDRFSHRISLVESSGVVIPLVESIEGTPTDDWPPSPPLQNLTIENRPNGRMVALLVGMASGSHWSASVEAIPGALELVFDVACRHATNPVWLGNRYEKLSALAATALTFQGDDLRLQSDELRLAVAPRAIVDGPCTTRWQFAIRLASSLY